MPGGRQRKPPAPVARILPEPEETSERGKGAAVAKVILALTVAFVMGLCSWSLECVAFGLVLTGAGAEANVALFAKAAFIYPLATLAGTVSFLPGGLGITEGGIAGMTQATLSLGAGPAAVASLVIRGAIVGLPVVLGVPSFVLLSRRSLRAGASALDKAVVIEAVEGCAPAA